jgi:transcriptional regulator with GAF, ATPase, and Fis domain
MTVFESSAMPSHEGYNKLFALFENALMTNLLDELAECALPEIAGIGETGAVFLYVSDSRLRSAKLFPHGFSPEQSGEIKRICSEQEKKLSLQNSVQTISLPAAANGSPDLDLVLYALPFKTTSIMMIGCKQPAGAAPSQTDIFDHLMRILAPIISMIVERMKSERQLAHLNAYLTVSSMLTKSQGLHEVLEIALYSCMELVAAEAATVLLLDEEKKSFSFYQVEGPAKPVLMAASFPSDQGLAGALLKTREAEVINDVQSDPRFYKTIDERSGFKTRNMIAVPLIAEEEFVGVLEVLNKAQGWLFRDEERLLLLSLAEEIAFAIRNARVFEYVAHSYCKQRQGQNSCAGCKRPLGSWTPCVKYREELL